jgi:hypothetical protein
MLPIFLYGCEARSLTLREEHRLRIFVKRVVGEYLNRRGMELYEFGGNCTVRSFKLKLFAKYN